MGRVTTVAAARHGVAWEQNDQISYDASGNVAKVVHGTAGDANQVECFRYDGRQRLERAFTTTDASCATVNGGGPNPYDEFWTFSGSGNITHRGTTGADVEYRYGAQVIGGATYRASVHAVSSTSAGDVFGYDRAGQMVTRQRNSAWVNFAWDPLGRLAWVGPGAAGSSDAAPTWPAVAPSGATTFAYDVDSTRRLRVEPNAAATTLYLDGFEVAKPSGGAATVSKYYAIDGETIAVRRQQIAGAAGTPVVIEAEAGSPQVTSDNGNLGDPIGGASGGRARIYSGGWSNYVQFNLGATVAGTYTVKLRYSTSNASVSTRRLSVNGSQVNNSFSLPATGWAWAEQTFTVTMTASSSGSIRFTTDPGNGSTGEVYFDRIEVTPPASGGNGVGSVTYLFANHQGSIVMASDHATAAASTVTRNRYTPYGQNRATDAVAQTQRGWIGQTEDPGGLSYLNARYYDPAIGRFVSVDPLSAPSLPQSLNGYSYGWNSPATFGDASGLFPGQEFIEGVGRGLRGTGEGLFDCFSGNCAIGRSPLKGAGPQSTGNWQADAAAASLRRASGAVFAGGTAAVAGLLACAVLCHAAAMAAEPWLFAAASAVTLSPLAAKVAGAAAVGAVAPAAGDSPREAATQAAVAFGLSYAESGWTPGTRRGAGATNTVDDLLSSGRQIRGRFPNTANADEVLLRRGADGLVTHYQIYGPDGLPVRRVDVTGAPHAGVPTPHVLEFERHVNPTTGQVFVRPAHTVRPALPGEIPGAG